MESTIRTSGDGRQRGEDGILLDWEPGEVILDLYDVVKLPGTTRGYAEGGMGRVNLVRHREWRRDLAVKSILPAKSASARDIEVFTKEAEQWVDRIGLHPNIVACHYVRVLGGVPRVFIEFVDGGTLSEWIVSKRLYEGGPQAALERILDVAIQTAWGLHYVHELGLIHQDVKPLNVMMTADGVAKVTDFGLAGARSVAFEEYEQGLQGGTILATWGGMTPAYCSPEQAEIAVEKKAGMPREEWPKLTRRTDVWSWAVSVLEMFLGERCWPAGQVAYVGLQRETDESHLPPPPAVKELLRSCLKKRPEDRPHDLMQVADALRTIYQQVTGQSYPREKPRPDDLLADTLNNRAVSLLDLSKPVESAERLWEKALEADPHHAETVYNLGLIRWRSGRTDDLELVRQLESIRDFNPTRVAARLYLGYVHLERGDCAAAVQELQGIQGEASGAGEVATLLARARESLPRSRRCLRTFRTSRLWPSEVRWVGLSGDGRMALVSTDTRIKLWNTSSGKCLRNLREFSGVAVRGMIEGVSLSSDGRLALAVCVDGAVRLWETSSGRCLQTFQDHASAVNAVSLSGDGRLALSGHQDGTTKLWDTSSGRCLHTFRAGKSFVWVRAVSLDGNGRLALVSAGTTIKLWETSSGNFLRNLRGGHRFTVYSATLNGDGHLAFTACSEEIKVWETSSGHCLQTFPAHKTAEVPRVSLSGDGNLGLSAGSKDKTFKLWDTSSGRCLHTFQGHSEDVLSVSLSGDGRLALSGGGKKVKLWETSWVAYTAPLLLSHIQSVDEMRQAQHVHDRSLQEARRTAQTGDDKQTLMHLRLARQQPGYQRSPENLPLWRQLGGRIPRGNLRGVYLLHTFEGHTHKLWPAVSLSGDGRLALSAGSSGKTSQKREKSIKLWETSSGRCLQTFLVGKNSVVGVSLSGDGRLALSGSADGTVQLWDTSSGECLHTFHAHTLRPPRPLLPGDTVDRLRIVALSGDGRLALTGSWLEIKLWDTSSGHCLHTLQSAEGWAASLSRDGLLAFTANSKEFKMWETSSGHCLHTFSGHPHDSGMTSVSLSSDGRFALSGSYDKTVKLWETSSGRCLQTFEGHTDFVYAVSLNGEGRIALSGSDDKTVKLWEASSGRCLHTFQEHTARVRAVCLSADGWLALSGCEDKTVNLWFLDWELDDEPDTKTKNTLVPRPPFWKRWFGLSH